MPTADTVGECQPEAWRAQLRDAPQLRPPPVAQRQAEETRIEQAADLRAEESDFKAQWGLSAINAHYAYARGATGTGVTVGVIDGGLDNSHGEFRAKVDDDSLLFYKNDLGDGTNDLTQPPAADDADALPAIGADETQIEYVAGELSGGRYPDRSIVCGSEDTNNAPDMATNTPIPGQQQPGEDDSLCPAVTIADGEGVYWRIPFEQEIGHGTAIVSTILGGRVGNGVDTTPYGVAYGANVLFAAIDYGSDDPPSTERSTFTGYTPILPAVLASDIDQPYRDLFMPFITKKIPVLNLSFGVPGLITDPVYTADNLRNTGLQTFIPLLAQAQAHPGERSIFVWAAGNANREEACLRATAYQCVAARNFAELQTVLSRIGFARNGIPVNDISNPADQALLLARIGLISATSPTLLPGLPHLLPELRGHSLAVVAVTESGTGVGGAIADFSNRCGQLPATGWDAMRDGRHYCLAAPGDEILSALAGQRPDADGNLNYRRRSGTSLAAPHVAGAIAVLIDFFTDKMNTPNDPTDDLRSVGNTAIVFRILETANRTGTYAPNRFATDPERAYSTIYGAGLLDLKAATEPIDPPVAPTGSTLTGPALPFSGTRLFSGRAYGDAFSRAFAGTRIATFDSMHFPFWHSLTSLVESVPRRSIYYHRARFSPPSRIATDLPGVGTFRLGVKTLPPVPRRAFRRPDATDPPRRRPASLSFRHETATGAVFAAWRSPDSTPLSLRESLPSPLSNDVFSHPFLSFADNGLSVGVRTGALTLAAFSDTNAPSPVHGFALEYALSPYFSAQGGMMNEKGGALGLRPDGAFGSLNTTSTAFTGLKLNAPIAPRWRVLAHAHLGTARPDVGGIGLVKDVSPLMASAFSAGVTGHGVLSDGDSLTLTVSQPLRVERGRVSLVVPTGRTPDGDLRRAAIDAGLEPSGREVTLSAAWTAPVGDAAYVRLAAGASREPGHDAAADNAFHALADVSFRF